MATIREVAGRAGVSPTTVSHVVNATRFVSHEIRARVMEAMTELGYHPNAVARSLRRGRTHTLGLVLPDSANPYFAELGRGIETAAFGRNYSVVLCNTEGEELRERVYVDLLTRRQVDGLLYVPAGNRVDVLRDLLRQPLPGGPGRPRSAGRADRRGPERQARRRLPGDPPSDRARPPPDRMHRRPVEPPHERPAAPGIPGCPRRSGPSRSTRASCCAATTIPSQAGRPPGACSRPRSRRRRSSRPTTSWRSASCAPPVSSGAASRTTSPSSGFDDIELASYTTPPLTTVSQSASEVGRAAVELLLQRLADPARPPVRRTLETRLVVRASCGNHA